MGFSRMEKVAIEGLFMVTIITIEGNHLGDTYHTGIDKTYTHLKSLRRVPRWFHTQPSNSNSQVFNNYDGIDKG
jgi:hypothetical protein